MQHSIARNLIEAVDRVDRPELLDTIASHAWGALADGLIGDDDASAVATAVTARRLALTGKRTLGAIMRQGVTVTLSRAMDRLTVDQRRDAYGRRARRAHSGRLSAEIAEALGGVSPAIAAALDVIAAAYYNRGNAYDDYGNLTKALIDLRVAVTLMDSSDPWKEKALTRTAEVERKLAAIPTVTAAPSKPAGTPETFTAGGMVVNVSLGQVDGQRITQILVEGELKPGDEKVFRNALLTADEDYFPIVFLNSPGGDLNAGIGIGNTIWTNEFVTVVLHDAICASACALAWLSGRPRYVELGAAIGFHAPTRVTLTPRGGRTQWQVRDPT